MTVAPPSHPGNLPLSRTPLVGRERESAAVCDLVLREDVPLVTLTGPGGVGKTRLAAQVAGNVVETFRDGVWYVGLAPIADPELVASTVAQVLGVRDTGDEPLTARLTAFLRDKTTLLVLDNFEQVVEAAPFVATLLGTCPGLKILVTSRARLRLSVEREYPVPPLGLAEHNERASVQEVGASEAVRLFVERAQAVQPDFALAPENATVVASVCRRLDGLPLAIELAAARIKVLPPAALLTRLERRLPLLTGGGRDLPARQQTMHDAIAWSHDLLTPAERVLFRRLAVFAGGFSLDAAEHVGTRHEAKGTSGEDGTVDGSRTSYLVPRAFVLDLVASLVDKSLLRRVEGGATSEPRFTMLETIRDYGLEQLAASGDDDATRRRLAGWCLALAEQEDYVGLFSPVYREWMARIEAEHDNLRLVLGWALDRGEAEIAQRLCFSLCRFWFLRGHLSEGRGWSERSLAAGPDTPLRVRALALSSCGFLAWASGELDRAADLLAEALTLIRGMADPIVFAIVLYVDALTAEARGEFDRAQASLEEAWPLFQAADGTPFLPHALNALGSVVYRQHADLDRAEALFAGALRQFRELDNTYGVAAALTNLGRIARDRGEVARADALYGEGLGLHWDDGDMVRIAGCLVGLATVAALSRRPERAARLLGAAEALREAIGAPVPRHPGQYARAVATARAALGEQAFAESWATGRALPLVDVVREATALSATAAGLAGASPAPAATHGLTSRELDVMRLLPRGLTNREIGEALFITERTAATHVQNIFAKLGVGSRSEAVAFAVEQRLV